MYWANVGSGINMRFKRVFYNLRTTWFEALEKMWQYYFCWFNTPHLTSRLASIASSYISSVSSGGGGKMTADGKIRGQPRSSQKKYISLSWYSVLQSQWIRTRIRRRERYIDVQHTSWSSDPTVATTKHKPHINVNIPLHFRSKFHTSKSPSFRCYI